MSKTSIATTCAAPLVLAAGILGFRPGAPPLDQYYATVSVSAPKKTGKVKIKLRTGNRDAPHLWKTKEIEVDVTDTMSGASKAAAIRDAINDTDNVGGTAGSVQNVVTFVPDSTQTVHQASSVNGKDTGEKDKLTRIKNDGAAPVGSIDPDDLYDPDRVRPTWMLTGDVSGVPIDGSAPYVLELSLYRDWGDGTELDVDLAVSIQPGDDLVTLGDRATADLQQALSAYQLSWIVLGREVRAGAQRIAYEITFASPLPPGPYTAGGAHNDTGLTGLELSMASPYLDADNE